MTARGKSKKYTHEVRARTPRLQKRDDSMTLIPIVIEKTGRGHHPIAFSSFIATSDAITKMYALRMERVRP